MKKHTKTTNTTPPKRFGKNFFKVVSTAVLVLAMAFGGIILAQRSIIDNVKKRSKNTPTKEVNKKEADLDCVEFKDVKGNTKVGSKIKNGKGWVHNRNICERVRTKETVPVDIQIKTKEIPKAKTLSIKKNPKAKPTGGKKDGSEEKDIFIPTRSKAEIMSFIKAVKTGQGKPGHNKAMYNEFEICIPGMSINQKEPAFDGFVKGCDTCGLTPHNPPVCKPNPYDYRPNPDSPHNKATDIHGIVPKFYNYSLFYSPQKLNTKWNLYPATHKIGFNYRQKDYERPGFIASDLVGFGGFVKSSLAPAKALQTCQVLKT